MPETELLTAEAAPREHRVRVTEGPDRGRYWPVHRPMTLGTSEHCDIRLEDPAVSRRHCVLEPRAQGVHITDHSSKNGLRVGRVRVADGEFPAGTELSLGRTVLSIEAEDGPWEEPTPLPKPRAGGFGRFLGESASLGGLYEALERVCASDVTVLLEGESGTGKELLAEALHELGPRKQGPFVVVDFAAMPETLIEATLFGHERGAFTGAVQMRKGAFEEAHGGTIFLDEIGELPPALQTRLLGVLERRRFTRVGGHTPYDVDVRVVAATNRNLEREVEEGRFRLDLFHRLAVALLRVPPLRSRPDDIERLARHFVRNLLKSAKQQPERPVLNSEVLARMMRHRWPGNVRELRNYVERLVVFGAEAQLFSAADPSPVPDRAPPDSQSQLAALLIEAAGSGWPFRQARSQVLDAFTQLYVQKTLSLFDGDVAKAAEAAQVARRHFNRLRNRG